MPDNDDQEGGFQGSIRQFELEAFLVAPATGNEKNTLRLPLIPVACWRLDDVRFKFDSSIVKPETRKEFADLAVVRGMHPGSPLSIFGHADPTGNDVYNKELSGRRAAAIYAVITRDVDIWEKLYSKPFGGDTWKTRAVQIMLTALGFDTQGTDGIHGPNTTQALKNFQTGQALSPTGADNADTRKKLFRVYMDFLCVDSAGAPFQVPKTEFLSRNQDPNGKGDFQGCSEFNPVLIFSQAQTAEFKQSSKKLNRDLANAPNRRVTALLFRPGSFVPPARWPCPAAKDGIAGCQARFFSDHKTRLTPGPETRLFEKTQDTFACRFYHRLTVDSPCEESVKFFSIRIVEAGTAPVNERQPIANSSFLLTALDGGPPIVNGITNSKGVIRIRSTARKAKFLLKIAGVEIQINAGELIPSGSNEAANRQRLAHLGYGPPDFTIWVAADADAAYRKFQREHALPVTGSATPATVDMLKELNGS